MTLVSLAKKENILKNVQVSAGIKKSSIIWKEEKLR
jgi:hypothetical protein